MEIMNFNKKKRKILIPSLCIISIIYIFVATHPVKPELSLTPEWTVDISNVQESTVKDLIPYRLGQSLGYFTNDGKVDSNVTFPFKASISESRYTTYTPDNKAAEFFNADGSKAGVLEEDGFPFFQDNKIYVMKPGGTSFARFDSNGKKIWDFEYYAPITAFNTSKNATVAGYADGTIISFDEKGNIDQKFTPGGSSVEVILGAAVSDDGKRIACICGQDKQRFVVAEKNGNHSKIVYHEYLPSELKRQTLVKFNKTSDVVYFNYSNGLGILDLATSKCYKLPVYGKISQIEFSSSGLIFVLSKNLSTYKVSVLEPLKYPLASFEFFGKTAFIQIKDKNLFVGCDSKISKISISRK